MTIPPGFRDPACISEEYPLAVSRVFQRADETANGNKDFKSGAASRHEDKESLVAFALFAGGVAPRAAFNHERLTPRETGIELVPVQHLRLAEPPAQIHHSAIHHRRKVDQTFQPAFRLDAQGPKLLGVLLLSLSVAFDLLLDLPQFFAVNVAGRSRSFDV